MEKKQRCANCNVLSRLWSQNKSLWSPQKVWLYLGAL
jgi:hypothetical protein